MKTTKLDFGSKQYCLEHMIGEGTYSKVYLAHVKLGSELIKLACKIINKEDSDDTFTTKFLPRELSVIRHISHPNIVSVFETVEFGKHVYVFMEYCGHGDLLEYVRHKGSLSERKSWQIFKQITSAIQYLHHLDISHRDLKCENIFLTKSNCVKLGDFGFARLCHNKETNTRVLSETFCGSAAYAAPEVLQGIPYYPKMYDIWSLGCILYVMLTGSMPFDDSNIKRMLQYQQNRVIYFSIYYQANWTNALRRLLCNVLEPDVSKRIDIHEVAQSEWIVRKRRTKNSNLVS